MVDVPSVLAVSAHPDDIEFLMAGTLLLLAGRGWNTHYQTLASGSCGSTALGAREISAIRREESRNACDILGATYHEPVVDDLELVYDASIIRRVAAVVRRVRPTIVLAPSPTDYMEDHTNACRVVVTATFARGMPNFESTPPQPPWTGPATVYHALPHGLRDGLRRRITPGLFVDTTSVHEIKREALSAHTSQRDFLETAHGPNAYLDALEEMSRDVGSMSGKYMQAEGWRRHNHIGFTPDDADPLLAALEDVAFVNGAYERSLDTDQ